MVTGVAGVGLQWISVPAVAAAVLALVAWVARRCERVSPLSWLDAAMGASAVAALAAALDAPDEVVIAASGLTAASALARWRLDATPGPEFSPVVLTTILLYAAVALVLLTAGQFVDVDDDAVVLAMITVLIGSIRAALTVIERLRDSQHQALTDSLTGLGNRRHLVDRLEGAIAEAAEQDSELALLLIDLDGFKELNDTLGHHAGDEVLRQIGPRLRDELRDTDTLARLGGDEFAVVLAPGDEASASTAGLRLRAALERSFAVRDIRVHVDASVGIALWPEHGRDALGLLQRADVAMYQAKRLRTGHEVYLPARDRHSRTRLALIGELRGAIETQQLELHYQPKARLDTGAVYGVEALVRWRHPSRGLLDPGQFLPLAEQSGLTRTLTAWVLDCALQEIGRHRADGFDLEVAVNLGPADLLDIGLPAEVARELDRHAFAAEHLRLEVSEDIVMADPERTRECLARLKAIGVATALDDFGTGQASLRNLKELEVDELKIDKTFGMRMPADERDAAIVQSTVDLGHRLGLRVVAEGVDTARAWHMLSEYGCDEAQGNFLARPMPAGELASWLRARAVRS